MCIGTCHCRSVYTLWSKCTHNPKSLKSIALTQAEVDQCCKPRSPQVLHVSMQCLGYAASPVHNLGNVCWCQVHKTEIDLPCLKYCTQCIKKKTGGQPASESQGKRPGANSWVKYKLCSKLM